MRVTRDIRTTNPSANLAKPHQTPHPTPRTPPPHARRSRESTSETSRCARAARPPPQQRRPRRPRRRRHQSAPPSGARAPHHTRTPQSHPHSAGQHRAPNASNGPDGPATSTPAARPQHPPCPGPKSPRPNRRSPESGSTHTSPRHERQKLPRALGSGNPRPARSQAQTFPGVGHSQEMGRAGIEPATLGLRDTRIQVSLALPGASSSPHMRSHALRNAEFGTYFETRFG